MADFQKRKYRKSYLIWTSCEYCSIETDDLLIVAVLHPTLRDKIDRSTIAREQIALFKVLNIEFYPRESHLVTFRDPWSFPVLFHPACNHLVRQHMEDMAQKVSSNRATKDETDPYRLSVYVLPLASIL